MHKGVIEIRMDSRELIARKSPGSCRPNKQKRGLLIVVEGRQCLSLLGIHQRKQHVHARIGHLAITLPDLAAGKRRAALSPPPDDLVALIEEAAVEEVFQRP